MPPTNAKSTAYTTIAHTTASKTPTPRKIASGPDTHTPSVNGPRVTGPTATGSLLARYRPLQFSKFPLFGQKARHSGSESIRRRRTSGQNFAAVSSPQPLVPTITAEHDPDPPPLYSPSIPLHASIVPNVSIPGGKAGSSNHGPSAPKAGAGASVTDVVVITISIILGVALIAITAFIYKIRRGNRARITQAKEKHSGVIPEPQAWQTFDGKTVASTSWSTPTLAKSPGATQSMETFKLGSQETIGELAVVEPTPHDSPFVISGSQSLTIISCDSSSDDGSLDGFSVYGPLDKDFQEKLQNEESDIICALSYAVSDSSVLLEAAVDPAGEVAPEVVEALPHSDANKDDFDPGVSIRSDDFESTCGDDTIAAEFSTVETAESRNLEATKAVLILVSSEAEVSQEPQAIQPDSSSSPETASLLNSAECQSAIASILTAASCNSLLQPPSLMITQPSSNNVFGLHSSSSTVTVDLNEFPPPPPTRVEVPLPQLELDFPVYIWDEDGDMLTVHQRNTVTDQFISMYS